jgi:hypothetical protein
VLLILLSEFLIEEAELSITDFFKISFSYRDGLKFILASTIIQVCFDPTDKYAQMSSVFMYTYCSYYLCSIECLSSYYTTSLS